MIGIFDSGFGGLTIFREIVKEMPQYDYVYLGDSARAPYGNHATELIYQYTQQAVDYLFRQGCQLIILACNTATAAGLRRIQREYLTAHYSERRVLGVIRPVIEAAAKMADSRKMGVLATRATVNSNAFQKELENLWHANGNSHRLRIYQQACPLLVPLIEEGWGARPQTREILEHYLKPLKRKEIDLLVLACTHYPILTSAIRKYLGARVKIINPGRVVALSLKDYLNRHPEIDAKLTKNHQRQFLTTDDSTKFEALGKKFLGEHLKAQRITLA